MLLCCLMTLGLGKDVWCLLTLKVLVTTIDAQTLLNRVITAQC